MILPKVLNATEARKNFYQLLKQVSSGAEILIENTDTGEKFQIIKSDSKPMQTDKLALLEEFIASHPVKLPDHSPEEIKQILSTRLDRDIE